ncbi:MAG: CPBP family intramembrane metalloprotease [Nannocystis sp.]|nr:CPBP family intramembrane metalloprotease [Nannocystis sp.]
MTEGKGRPTPQAATVAGFYALVLLVGFFWHAVAEESNDVWRLDAAQGWVTVLWTPLVGVFFGLAVVRVFRALDRRYRWLWELHREFRDLLGRPSIREILVLAGASSLAEEVLFRGAMLDAWGVWWSSVVFAGLHVGPRRTFWPWTASSLLLGLALGGLTLLTGNLGAAVAAHFVINLLNLYHITRTPPRAEAAEVASPAPAQPL